jgi:hypothetical protein
MKIGILTYHRAHNYGAMLQAYALRTFLQDNGYVVDFIDYWPQYHNQQYALIRPILGDTLKNRCINLFSAILTLRRRYKRRNSFENFREQYLGLSSVAQYTLKESTLHDVYDCVIVGSDQIWRNRYTSGKYLGWDKTYFCQTISTCHCISYAASMGVISLDDTERKQLTSYLKRFDTLLVREQSLCDLIKDCGYSAEVVLDPTLLFTKETWNRVLPRTSYRRHSYVLYYELLPDANALSLATAKAAELGCELVILDANIHTIPRRRHIQYASPIEFMHAVRDAEFVVATSFHGTAFSIIFEKQFITIGLKDNADRVLTLLQAVGIPEHYQTCPLDSIPVIDYSLVSQALNTLRHKSQNLLLDAINKPHKQ